jgi:hypothetical protein
MSISSIPASPPAPVAYPNPGATTKPAPDASDNNKNNNADDVGASQPVQPPLPPGQGTRVNQLV